MSPKKEGDVSVAEPKTKVKPKLQKPQLYKVLLHNDDYTPGMFVVQLLIHVFNKSESDALAIMQLAERDGAAVAGVYTYEIAETKVQKVSAMATEAQVPLLCTMEPE